MQLLSEHACFGGVQRFYQHDSSAIGLPMKFGVYLPPQALQKKEATQKNEAMQGKVPVLFYLAGLTCNEETFAIKAGAQRFAALHGIAIVTPDTSPRGAGVPGESDYWDFGMGAGFYIDATQAAWSKHYRMETYVASELPGLLASELPLDMARAGIFGHSMGGHGALTLALKYPELFRSVSAFAQIAAPAQCPWGEKAFSGYLGDDREQWLAHDATALMAQRQTPFPAGILVDQGLADKFLVNQLHPDKFEAACAQAGQPLTLRWHEGYDHGYYFIATLIGDHLAHHARQLQA
ncbi:MAG: S-formylglutathione hydrolase [Moraxellaceae bacterium]|nr:S-formylglutathione hydrolase [Moraxellaceae bacterium]